MLAKICIISYIVFIVIVFSLDKLFSLTLIASVFLLLMIVLPYRKLKSGILPISLFLLVTFSANLLFNTGKIITRFGPFVITEEGLYLASVRTLRIFLLIAGAKFLTVLSSIEEMIYAMGGLMSPLEKLKIPVHNFFSLMALAVKVIPVIKRRLADEYQKRIGSAEKKGIREKTSIVFEFLLPVFYESIDNPQEFFRDHDKNQFDKGKHEGV